MLAKSFLLFSLVGLTSACALGGGTDDSPLATSQLSADGTPAQVTWNYVDRIGRAVELDTDVPGMLEVELVGSPLPIAGTSKTLQSATVTLMVPSLEDPDAMVERRFFVRFEGTQNAAGGTAYRTPAWGSSSIVDASLPNATARFATTYDPATQTARQQFALAPDLASAAFSLDADADGELTARQPFMLGGATTKRADFALHTTTISLQ